MDDLKHAYACVPSFILILLFLCISYETKYYPMIVQVKDGLNYVIEGFIYLFYFKFCTIELPLVKQNILYYSALPQKVT